MNLIFHRLYSISRLLLLTVIYGISCFYSTNLNIGFKFHLSARKFCWDHKTFHHKKFLQVFQKVKPSSDFIFPITPNILNSLLLALEHTPSSFFTKCLLRAMFLVAFCAFLRIREITKTSGTTHHFILFGNVTIKSDAKHGQYIEITIPRFKHAKSSTSTIWPQQNKTFKFLST